MNELLERQVVVFYVGNDKFALDILQIREIARYQAIRKIPRAPEFLSGVTDLRGTEIVPVIGLHDRLGLEPVVNAEKSRIIIAPIDGQPVGFTVDSVRDVMVVDGDSIEPPPKIGTAPGFLEGVIRSDNEIILLLDLSNVLTSEEKLHMEELRSSLLAGDEPRDRKKSGETATKRPSSEKKGRPPARKKPPAKKKRATKPGDADS